MNGPMGMPGSGPIFSLQHKLAEGWLPPGHIYGLTLSNDSSDAVNDIVVAPGSCRSTVSLVNGAPSTLHRNQMDLELPAAVIKQLDVAFAPSNYDGAGRSGGGRGGMRSTSSLADGTWHINVVGKRGQPSEVMAHNSATQASTLAEMQKVGGYTAYRRIGSIVRAGGAILGFIQHGDTFDLKAPLLDIDTASPGTSAVTGQLLSVPTGIVIQAMLHVIAPISGQGIYISELDATDSAASSSAAPLASLWVGAFASNSNLGMRVPVWLNTSAQFRYRMTSNVVFRAAPIGWRDLREKEGPL